MSDAEAQVGGLFEKLDKALKIAGTLSDYVESLTTDGFGLDKEVVDAVEELDKMWRDHYGD